MWKYELFKDTAGHWRWHLRADNGRVVSTSGEAFASRANALRAAAKVRANGGTATLPADPYPNQVLGRTLVRVARRDAAQKALHARLFGPR